MSVTEIHKLASFVDSLHYREKTGPQLDPKKGCFPFVTISRQAGAGGQALASLLAEKIQKLHQESLFQGWQLCNQELCHMVAQDPVLKSSVESLKRTEYHSHAEDMLSQLIYGGSSQDIVVKKMFHLMRVFALHGRLSLLGVAQPF